MIKVKYIPCDKLFFSHSFILYMRVFVHAHMSVSFKSTY